MASTTAGTSWFGERTRPPEIGLPHARIAEVVQHELRDMPLPAYPIALQPLLAPQGAYRELLSATRDLLALLRRAVLALAPDRAGRLAALGADPDDCPIWVDDEEFELRHCADMCRADVVIGPDGPRFVEFNVSGAFGGMVHFRLYQRAWHRIRELAGRPSYLGIDPYARVARLVERTCAELGVPPSVVLVGTPREWGPETSTRNFDLQVDELRQHGIDAVHLDFEDLLEGLALPDGRMRPLGIGAFTVQDAMERGYDISPVRTALDAGFRLIPTASSWLLHSKKLLAILSEGTDWMTAADRALVDRYVPWSRLCGDRKVEWRGGRYDLPDLLIARQPEFVLKGATGDAGREVIFGARTAPGDWAELVDQAMCSDYFLVQEVVHTPPYPVEVMLTEAGEVERMDASTVISPFCIGGEPAGCFARFVPDRRPGVISALSNARLSCLLAEV